MSSTSGEGGDFGVLPPGPPFLDDDDEVWPGPRAWPRGPGGIVGAGRPAVVEPLPGAAGTSPVQRLHDVLAGAGVDLTPSELADALWLALAQGAPEPAVTTVPALPPRPSAPPPDPGYAGPAHPGPGLPLPPESARIPPPPVRPGSPPAGMPAPEPPPKSPPGPAPATAPAAPPHHHPVYALADARPGRGGAPVRVPGVPGLPNPLDVVRALRPLKRRVSSLHRFELDEAATAEAIADSGGPDIVLRPEQARWLDLVLAVDDGIGLRVWQDTLTELTRVLGTSGIFRTVRRVGFAATPVNSAVVDGNRTAVLAVTDGVGPAWRSGAAHRTLAAWARKAPTAVLHPLPLRLWQGTALPAERLRVRSGRPAPANHLLRAYDPWLPPHLAEPLELPVPVLELGDWSLGPWASLIASRGGTAHLHVVDAAARVPPTPPPTPTVAPADRLLAFQETVSPEAYELAAHLASVDPLTLPVMRVVQSAALPGTSPSCLAEVLLSGLMRVDTPLAGFDVYTFDPEVRALLRMAVPATDARRTVDAVTAFVTPRLGRAPDFPALIAARTGTLALPREATPFAELPAPDPGPDPYAELPPHPSEQYVVAVWDHAGGRPRSGYVVADGMVLTAVPGESYGMQPATVMVEFAAADAHVRSYLIAPPAADARVPARLVAASGEALLYRVEDPVGPEFRVPPLLLGHVRVPEGAPPEYDGVTAHVQYDREFGRPRPGTHLASLALTRVRVSESSHRRARPVRPGESRRPGTADTVHTTSSYVSPSSPRFVSIDCVLTGGAVFDGNALCGIVVRTARPQPREGEREVLPTPLFALDEAFFAALGSPATDLERPGRPVHEEFDPDLGYTPPGGPRPPRPTAPPRPETAPPPALPAVSPDSVPAPPDTARGLALPPPPAGLTLDEVDALRELKRAALPAGGYVSGTLVLVGTASGPRAVAAAFAAEHRRDFSGVFWYTGVAHPLPSTYPARDEAPLLVVLEDCEDELLLLPERGLLVLSLGHRLAGRGFQEIRVGPGVLASRVDHPLVVTAAPGPRVPGSWEPADQPVRVSGNLPGQVLDDLLRMLPWLGGSLSFDVLEMLWAVGPLNAALGALGETGALAVSWVRREVSLLPGQRALRVVHGRKLAEWMLLGAYGEERLPHRPRQNLNAEELARYVLALSNISPEDDDEYSVRLFARAARYLLQYGDAPTGVRLAERALEYVERQPLTGTARPLAVESRAELARLAVESGLGAFLALSRKSVGSYALESSGSTLLRWGIQREVASAFAAQEAGDRSGALQAFERAHGSAVDLFGSFDPLSRAIQTTMSRLDP